MQEENNQGVESAVEIDFNAAWDDDFVPGEETAAEEADAQGEPADQREEPAEREPEVVQEEAAEQESTAEKVPETFTLRYMKEDKQYSRDDTIALAQKGLDYDRIRADRDSIKAELPELRDYKGFLEELAAESKLSVEQLIENVRANRLMEQERAAGHVLTEEEAREQVQREKAARRQNKVPETEGEAELEAPKTGEPTARKSLDVQAFCKAFPGVEAKDIPQAVWEEVRGGANLTSAYTRYENKQLRAQIEAMQQNEKNKNRSTGSRQSSGNAPSSVYDQAWDAADY